MSYLGPKGYTIYKDSISPDDLKTLKEELTVKPYVPKSPIQPPSFPIYRENANKIYIPRYYGIENYGEPHEMKIPKGDDINVSFVGSLRPDQQNIVDIFMKNCRINNGKFGGGGLLDIPCGKGKTVDGCKIISVCGKKTLVIVHKEFLLNQWIERIGQFLPSARVGKIQGQIIDIENKDIVLGMLQSLSMKDYPEDIFSSFGLTIVDECHHISSEVFSRSLQKIITFYTLGLSATMQRKDGLTKVFKMFLGDIIYQEKRENDDKVLVKAIEYITHDPVFNKVEYDYRGNPAFSTMISKLCTYNRRSEFIIKILIRELAQKAGQQVMILAHNRNLLTYLYDAIKHRNIGTVGYYVGGMKEAELKKSELCQIVIATYSMAAEALDIKTLTTLILATPKTDIEQAVGRILRAKHTQPIVVDIVDNHDIFQNQYRKRKVFYVKNNYKIIKNSSTTYNTDYSSWKVVSDKKECSLTKRNKEIIEKNDLVGKCFIKIKK
jgi:superfamily II DNA or RNA helicase